MSLLERLRVYGNQQALLALKCDRVAEEALGRLSTLEARYTLPPDVMGVATKNVRGMEIERKSLNLIVLTERLSAAAYRRRQEYANTGYMYIGRYEKGATYFKMSMSDEPSWLKIEPPEPALVSACYPAGVVYYPENDDDLAPMLSKDGQWAIG
jgi:hypothetical protein